MKLRVQSSLLIVGALILGSCSSSDSDESTATESAAESCASLHMDPPKSGAQYSMNMSLDVGEEGEWCKLFVVPHEMWINASTIGFTPGSHHSFLWSTQYRDVLPTVSESGVVIDPERPFPCPAGPLGDWKVDAVLAAAQSNEDGLTLRKLPEGVAFHVDAGAVLLMDNHMLNASKKPLNPCFVANLETVPAEQVQYEAGFIQFYNLFISVPAHGTDSPANACPVTKDVKLLNLVSHMHSRGTRFVANLEDANGAVLQNLFDGREWHDPVAAKFGAGLDLKAGEWIDYHCEFKNDSDVNIAEGLKTTDEMCVLDGTYYPRDRTLERCGTEYGSADGVQYSLEGTANGLDFVNCWYRSPQEFDLGGGPSNQQKRYDTQRCVTQLCRNAAKPVRPFMECLRTQGPGCYAICPTEVGPAQWDCLAQCIQEDKCKAEYAAVAAATCD